MGISMLYRVSYIILLFLVSFTAIQAQRKPLVEEGKTGLYSGYKFPKAVKKDRYRIAVISSLYLDSLELEKVMTHMPKLMQQGIDFIKGVEIAADTLNRM
ncbi:MAG TPA: hypothetical protein PLP34_01460, partial [Chitinophagaceae bacterium]|nr:hypothetical protein [Chitinophagaceae bacterium]